VPQGLANIPNLLAEVALTGHRLSISSKPGIWYQRYVDGPSLINSPQGQAVTVAEELITELKKLELKPPRLWHKTQNPSSESD